MAEAKIVEIVYVEGEKSIYYGRERSIMQRDPRSLSVGNRFDFNQ